MLCCQFEYPPIIYLPRWKVIWVKLTREASFQKKLCCCFLCRKKGKTLWTKPSIYWKVLCFNLHILFNAMYRTYVCIIFENIKEKKVRIKMLFDIIRRMFTQEIFPWNREKECQSITFPSLHLLTQPVSHKHFN